MALADVGVWSSRQLSQSPVREWRLHVGCHKTATTHLQNALELLQGELRSHGLHYITRASLRRARVLKKLAAMDWLLALGQWPVHARGRQLISPLRDGGARVLISEENFLGSANDLLRPHFYPRLERRMKWVDALCGDAKLHVFLSLRSCDELLPSAYAEALRTRVMAGGFAAIQKAVVANPPSWVPLVRRLRAALPRAQLQIWRFEDYRSNPSAVIAELCGAPIRFDRDLSVPSETRTPSGAAIARIEQLDPRAGKRQHVASVARILGECGDGEKFAPFTAAERDRLREAYASDVRIIREEFPGALLEISAGMPGQTQAGC